MTTADVDILVIGAGQAGLSVGYHLRRLGLRPGQDFLIVDHAPGPGGAWQFRWPSLTLTTVNRVHDLPGMSFAETLPPGSDNVPAATAVPHYFALYEQRFELAVHRPVSVRVVCDRATAATCPIGEADGLLHAEAVPGPAAAPPPDAGPPGSGPAADHEPRVPSGLDGWPTTAWSTGHEPSPVPAERELPVTGRAARRAADAQTGTITDREPGPTGPGARPAANARAEVIASEAGPAPTTRPATTFRVRGLVNATGTWEKPFIPYYPGAETFAGRQLHAHDYRTAAEFAGAHVVVVGAGISAIQLLDEISQVTTTTWVSRTEPRWRETPFSPDDGRRAVALVEDRVRRGLPPRSVVSVTGLPVDDRIRAARSRGVLRWHPVFQRIEPEGVRWADGTFQPAQVILWATGFRSALDHLAPLRLRGPGGGITMTGRLATQVAADPRIHLIGYGPSASTIGANRAGRAAAVELTEYLSPPGRRARRTGPEPG
ncbi:NAD(P)-binding protein [Nocardia aurantia]|uniref:NAD(P)-binding protein n=1 Tax=Nocardia aurantia TaxID=2585199 RepID=UPI0029E8003B|nr:NAD(P)-binding protein [Nocardia aurantia]